MDTSNNNTHSNSNNDTVNNITESTISTQPQVQTQTQTMTNGLTQSQSLLSSSSVSQSTPSDTSITSITSTTSTSTTRRSAKTLWFEFLLDPKLLAEHLNSYNPDPSPTDLIIKFSSINPDSQQVIEVPQSIENDNGDLPSLKIDESEKFSRKNLALKILCLKVAAYLKWNLDILEAKLSPQIQSQLVQDLVYMATDGAYTIPPQTVTEELIRCTGVRFAFVLYHRWVLRFLIRAKQIRQSFINMNIVSTDGSYMQVNAIFEKLHRRCKLSQQQSIDFLVGLEASRVKTNAKVLMKIPCIDTFPTLSEDLGELQHDWNDSEVAISENEFYMQIHLDLCANFFFNRNYDLARKHILICNDYKNKLVKEKHKDGVHKFGFDWNKMEYAHITEDEIHGYMKALNISQEKRVLLHDLHEAMVNSYNDIIPVLQADNLAREIPLVHRYAIEVDIQGSSASGIFTVSRDLFNKIISLNAVRAVLEGELPSTYIDFNERIKNLGAKFIENIYWAFAPVIASDTLSDSDIDKIKKFFLHLTTSEHCIPLVEMNNYLKNYVGESGKKFKNLKLFEEMEIEEMMSELDVRSIEIPNELLTSDWETMDFYAKTMVPDLEMGYLKQKLIDAMTAEKIRESLVHLAIRNPAQPLWSVNPQWKIPAPIHSVIMQLPRGFLQDFSYVLLAKAKQLTESGDHSSALDLLLILETETKNQLSQTNQNTSLSHPIYKLNKLIGWEALLMQITQVLATWPNHKVNMPVLLFKCSNCIAASQGGDSVIPRTEIVEMCCIALLNGLEWEQLIGKQRISGLAEAASATAVACHHLASGKFHKKFPEDLWDMLLPIFATNLPNNKRSNTGNLIYSNNRESPQTNTKMRDGMTSFLAKLREPAVLSIVISLLARLFNILKDDSNMDLNIEHINLWPMVITNTNLYNIKAVSETLHQLVTQALKYYPSKIQWIKLLADLSLVGGYFAVAMKYYLSALTIMSDYFVQPLVKPVVEDQTIFRRMIKCCTQLSCPTQAAILCQFLEDTDYNLAFRCLAEMNYLCADAMDSYYGCIWDTTILEYLINLHHKRGETHRKQLAVKVLGMMELNSNNNAEIQGEAAKVRKSKFMRALTRQYIC